MANRLTMHNGYRNAMGKAYNSKHNQREGFSKVQPEGVPEPPKNVYWDYGATLGGKTFSENEMRFYKRFLGPHIKRQNDKNKDARHYERCETVASYKEKHPPEEVLIYLGTENVDVAALEAVFKDFKTWLASECWDNKKGGVVPLNAALHLDEKTPHIQFRRTYLYKDKNGDWQVSQNKALDVLGYERPDPSKPVGRMNNAKMTFTAACREKLLELAAQHNVELVTEPLPRNEVGLPIGEYVQRQQARDAAAAEQAAAQTTIEALEADIKGLRASKEVADAEAQNARRAAETICEDIQSLDASRTALKELYEREKADTIERARADAMASARVQIAQATAETDRRETGRAAAALKRMHGAMPK